MRPAVRRALPWVPIAAHSGLIFYLSAQSILPRPAIAVPFIDKWEHFVAYGIWAFLFSFALRRTAPGLPAWAWILLTVLAGMTYGASDEFHQFYVRNRSCDPVDWAADTAGVLLGTCAHAAWRYRKNKPVS